MPDVTPTRQRPLDCPRTNLRTRECGCCAAWREAYDAVWAQAMAEAAAIAQRVQVECDEYANKHPRGSPERAQWEANAWGATRTKNAIEKEPKHA